MMRISWPLLAAVLTAQLLAGCAGNPLRSYDNEMSETVTLLKRGELDKALAQVESNNKSMFGNAQEASVEQDKDKDGKPKEKTVIESVDGKDILYFFEKGEILAMQRDYAGSRKAWLQADEVVRVWEDEFRTNPTQLLGNIGSFLVSDRVRRYDGQDYEKVFLSTKLTLSHLLQGDVDLARIEMKKTYEREKLIESFREKEYESIQESEKEQGVSADVSELGKHGYPMAELETPEVSLLKNGYQNAFAHYLAGYFFEVNGEYSLAEPGYRNALALRSDSQHIKERLAGIGRNRVGKNQADVLFVIESGFAPAWESITVPLPVRLSQTWVATPLSFPVVRSKNPGFVPSSLKAGGSELPVETLVDVDAMSRRLLKDQLPGILGRTVVRAIVKSAAQQQAQKSGGPVLGLITAVASVVTEQSDERAWRTLPDKLAVARAVLPKGRHTLEFATPAGPYRVDVDITQRLSIVPIRLTGGAVFVGQPTGQLPEPVLAEVESPASPSPATTDPPKAKSKKTSKTKSKMTNKSKTTTKSITPAPAAVSK
jgi:hypothetical protein